MSRDYFEEYDEVMQCLEEAGIGYGYGENLINKITTAAVIEELKRLLGNATVETPLTGQILARILELEEP